MGKWFQSGLTNDELKKEYRRLAKEYHPDLHPGMGHETMQEINNEYDHYFDYPTTSPLVHEYGGNNMWANFWRDIFHRQQDRQNIVRELLIFMIRDRIREEKSFVGYNSGAQVDYLGRSEKCYDPTLRYVGVGEEWANKRSGLHFVRLDGKDMIDFEEYTCHPIDNVELTLPTLEDFSKIVMVDDWSWRMDTQYALYSRGEVFRHIKSEVYGELWIGKPEYASDRSKWLRVYSMVNGKLLYAHAKQKWLEPFEVIEEYNEADAYVMPVMNLSFKDFMEGYDLDWNPGFDQALKMERDTSPNAWMTSKLDITEISPAVASYFRKGYLKIFRSKLNYRNFYGTLDYTTVIRDLHKLDPDDIDDVQDYLDEINKNYQEAVRGMIKKGKLKLDIQR